MKRTKILHLLLSMNVGGAEKMAASLVNGSDLERFEHEVCCLDEIGVFGESLSARGFRATLLKRKSGVDWCLIIRMAALLFHNQIDIIHAHGETPWFYATLAATLTFGRTKCITTVHGYGGGDRSSINNYRLWKLLTWRSEKVVVVARNLREEMIAAGLPNNKITTIWNGVNIDARIDMPVQSRTTWGIGENDFVVGIVARLSQIKNHRLLFQAVKTIRDYGHNLRLVVVGDGPERGALKVLCRRLELDDQVIFCGEQVHVQSFYPLFDVFVLPSFSEGISMTLLEAMAAKIPVVASAVGGNCEIIDHKHSGLLFPSGDENCMVECLLKLNAQSDLRKKLALNGWRKVQKEFSLMDMIENYHAIYNSLSKRAIAR